MIKKIFYALYVAFIVFVECEVVHLLIMVFRAMTSPNEDVINDSFSTRTPTFIMVHTIFGTVTLSWRQYVSAIVVLQLLVIVISVAEHRHGRG